MALLLEFFWGLLRVFTGRESIFKWIYFVYFRLTGKTLRNRFTHYDYASSDLCETSTIVSKKEKYLEYRRCIVEKETDSVLVFGTNSQNDRFLARVSLNKHQLASTWFYLHLSNGNTYRVNQQSLFNVPKTSEDCFVGGDLRIRCLIPMRKWKISFNGLLLETSSNGNSRHVHARINFIWSCLAFPHDLQTDISPSLLADFYSQQKSFKVFNSGMEKLSDDLDSYIQPGSMIGNVRIEEDDEMEISLWGSRKRSLERNKPTDADHFELISHSRESHIFHAGYLEFPNMQSRLRYGYAVLPNGFSETMNISQFQQNGSPLELKKVLLSNEKLTFELNIGKTTEVLSFPTLQSEHQTSVRFVLTSVDGEVGQALIIYKSRGNDLSASQSKPFASLPKLDESLTPENFVVSLTDLHCQNSSLTGGKGSSLGCLNYLRSKVKPEYFVPKGLVVTTFAYSEFDKLENISSRVNSIENVAWKNQTNALIEEACQKTVSEVSILMLPKAISEAVEIKLQEIYGNELGAKRFAVRSSAAGEDSEEMSAAGQMQTYLGVSGLNEIMESIVKCWASQFSFTAIQYKRQNGQLLNSLMAVVIQEMVPADVAGVLFTRNPVNGNPKHVTITANYGIGESVVSATADPDTVVLGKNEDNSFEVKSYIVGGKKLKTVMSDNGGVVDVNSSEDKSKDSCLSNSQAENLCKIALKLEESYGCPLDIEWALRDGSVFLLQARPITTLDRDTELDIIHENDTGLRCEDEFLTRANIGEVWSGAVSPFGATTFLKTSDMCCSRHYDNRERNTFSTNPFSDSLISYHYSQGFINVCNFSLRFHNKKVKSFVSESIMMAGYGRLLDDTDLLDRADKRNKFYAPFNIFKSIYYIIYDILFCKKRVIQATIEAKMNEVQVNESDDSMKMFLSIFQQYNKGMEKKYGPHLECSGSSLLVNCAIMYILVSASGGWNNSIFSDFARILSSCKEVESAEVPEAIEDIVRSITQSSFKEKLMEMNDKEIADWLQMSDNEPGIKFRSFIKKHGHRCVNEFDVYSKPWRVNPLPIIQIIQGMIKNFTEAPKRKSLNVSETIEGLTTSLTFKSKFLLKLLIPLCRRSVGSRELSKSLLIRAIDELRRASVKLAKKMVEEGRLLDEELFYFLSIYEVPLLLETRSPKLVQKAVKRRAMHEKLNKNSFPEIVKGMPKPINAKLNSNEKIEATFTLKGVPVSEGYIKGPARVAVLLEEAKLIQPGEILIARGTDIGWSPYFPILAGVATELGGLVSHGAVVAREYGLPCVVGVFGATDMFKSGDIVILDGTKGLLQKVES